MVWIPDKKLVKDASVRKRFDLDDVERSVTAPEIEYGRFGMILRFQERLSVFVHLTATFPINTEALPARLTSEFT
jgi:hypothetical protein